MRIPEGTISPVTTDNGFTFSDLSEEKVDELINKFKAEDVTFELFDERLAAWPFDEDCNRANKKILFKRSVRFCIDELQLANELIHTAKKEEITNLIAGASGATHPVD